MDVNQVIDYFSVGKIRSELDAKSLISGSGDSAPEHHASIVLVLFRRAEQLLAAAERLSVVRDSSILRFDASSVHRSTECNSASAPVHPYATAGTSEDSGTAVH